MARPELRDQANLTLASVTKETGMNPVSAGIDGRERIKIEFYKTYDVMTGIRIAATLGGFFSMMILLVLYKNYCKPSKSLSEEQLNAAVSAAVEEEDRALKAALEATSFYTSLSKHRQSVAHESSAVLSPRFSSVGGGCSHLTPPVRFSHLQQRGKSLPGSALRFSLEDSHQNYPTEPYSEGEEEKEDFETDAQLPDYLSSSNYLSVPPDRRLSSITCSSADSSYLERRGSAFEMGLPAPPGFAKSDGDKLREEGPWDFYYPIDIQVIQPTPEISPAASAETLCEQPQTACGLQVPGFHKMQRLSVDASEMGNFPIRSDHPVDDLPLAGPAPLASISSLGSCSSRTVNPEQTEANQEDSIGSDSVFMDEELDTEDEVEEFSTDTEFEYDGFDDDYSFCESAKRPISRCRRRSLQFASFDSYDASIAQDTLSEDKAKSDKPILRKQFSMDVRRASGGAQEGVRTKKKLSKTHSEPRTQRIAKQLPPWVEKGRSGFVPKRQLSVPAAKRMKRKTSDGEPALPEANDSTSSTDSNTTTSNVMVLNASTSSSVTPQGLHKDLPLTMSLQIQENRRKRFQKQKTVHEDWTEPNGRGQLRLPQIRLEAGSCERLNVLPREDEPPEGQQLLLPGASSHTS